MDLDKAIGQLAIRLRQLAIGHGSNLLPCLLDLSAGCIQIVGDFAQPLGQRVRCNRLVAHMGRLDQRMARLNVG